MHSFNKLRQNSKNKLGAPKDVEDLKKDLVRVLVRVLAKDLVRDQEKRAV